MIFGRKKKEQPHKGDVFLAKGVYLKKPAMDNGRVLLNCFLRSLIVFMLTFGSLGGFLSSFSISYNYVLVIVSYILLSMYFSFLYSTSKLLYRDVGYIVFFLVFIGAIASFRLYANSGLYTVVNAILVHAQDFFRLSGVRQYDVMIDNAYFTVAVLAVFIGVVMIILLNIWISSSMSFGWTILITFPILLIPLYLKQTPDSIYLICLCVGYFMVLVFKGNGHFIMYSWDSSFRIKGLKKDKLTYTQDFKVFGQIQLWLLVMGFCMVLLLELLFPYNLFEGQFKQDRLREQTADTIGNFLLLGFSGLYNRYGSTGGLAEGKLGGISNVRADYQTDLLVSYAPYSAEAVYLKGYTGGIYEDNQWYSIYAERNAKDGRTDTDISMDERMRQEASQLQIDYMRKEDYSSMGKMTVKNIGANPGYQYYPYYTLFDNYAYTYIEEFGIGMGLEMDATADYEYYPKQVWEPEFLQKTPKDMNLDTIDEMYLDVPQKNLEVIQNECEKIGISSDMEIEDIVSTLQQYYEDNIPYTLKPGATPEDEDFINYFLTKNRKGYCAHFASASTLILRQLGIPARYVEGYAFSFEAALASDENKTKKYKDYFKGYSSIGESTVLDVEVTDAMAHAWVEIYIDGFGWKQIEVTPGSNEIVEEDDFWSAFSSALQNTNMDIPTGGNGFGTLNLSQYTWLIYIVLAFFLLAMVFYLVRMVVRKIKRYARCHQKNQREALICLYADICDMLRLCDASFNSCSSHLGQLQYMKNHGITILQEQELSEQLEKLSYSLPGISDAEMQTLKPILMKIRKEIWKKAGVLQRLRLYRR